MGRRAFGIAFVGLAALAACGETLAADADAPPAPDGGPDAAACGDTSADPNNCGVCGNRCGPAKVCVSGACVPGCQGKVLYVSAEKGNDGNDGCTPDTAMRSIGAALAFVSTQGLGGHEIHVCRGNYAEHALVLDHAASLRGGYNCVTWTRATPFGADSGFQDPNETVITNADYVAISTLDIAGAGIGPDVTIDGFTIAGAATGTRSSDALVVRDGARPLLSDLKLTGGATSNVDGYGSTALHIRDGASPEVKRFVIAGGAGSSPAVGSAAILVAEASASIHDGAVAAGAGSGASTSKGVGTFGIRVEQQTPGPPTTIANVLVSWNGAHAGSTPAVAAEGISVSVAPVTITGCHVIGGGSICDVGGCYAKGVEIMDVAGARVVGNTIYAGEISSADSVKSDVTFGLSLLRTTNAVVSGNAIHAGARVSPDVAVTIGIDVLAGSAPQIAGNTIVFTGGDATHIGLRAAGTEVASNGVKGLSLEGNLFVGSLAPQEFGFELDSCAGATVAVLKNDLFVSTTYAGRDVTTCSPQSSSTYATGTDLDKAFMTSGAAGDIIVAPVCNGGTMPTSCQPVACTTADDCASKIFKSWDSTTLGASNTTSADGFRLAPGTKCAIAESLYVLPAGVTSDAYGAARTSPYSIGAAETDDTCTP